MRPATLSRHLLIPLRVAVLSLPALGLLGGTAFAFVALVAWLNGTTLADPRTLSVGATCALVAWLFVTIFHFRKETFTLSVPDRDGFVGSLRQELDLLGYEGRADDGDVLHFRPVFTAFVFGGGIRARLADGAATLTGPRLFLEILRKRLRVDTSVLQALSGRRLRPVRRLKRVQFSIRIAEGQWPIITRDLVDALAREGAEVVYDLEVLAHSDRGITEATVDAIRSRLAEQQIRVSVRKELDVPPRRAEAVAG